MKDGMVDSDETAGRTSAPSPPPLPPAAALAGSGESLEICRECSKISVYFCAQKENCQQTPLFFVSRFARFDI